MAKVKVRREIVSVGKKRFMETVEKTRATQSQQLSDEIHREEALSAPDGNMDVTNREAQRGRWMLRSAMMTKLRRLNPTLRYAQSSNYPKVGGVYCGQQFICGVPHEAVNEFAVRITVPKVIPDPTIAQHWRKIQAADQQEPGWRSILLRLIMDGYITPSGAEREFEISKGRSSRYWQQAAVN